MANFHDFKKKEPSKTEKVLYDMMMRQEMADRSLWTNSAFISAMAMLQDIDPEKIAEILVNGNDRVKAYSQKINDAIERLEKDKKGSDNPAEPKQQALENEGDDENSELPSGPSEQSVS